MYEKIVNESVYFKGFSEKEKEYAFEFFNAKVTKVKKGAVINSLLSPLSFFGLVLEGQIQVQMLDIDGNEILMASNGPGDSFGESLCFLEKSAPIYIVAKEDTVYLQMNTKSLKENGQTPLDLQLCNRFISILAERTLKMNNRIHVLSKVSIREKLMTFFAQVSEGGSKKSFHLPFNRNDMAVYLGVNRSALSRELSAMQEEGLIRFQKNHFEIL